jgi:aminopeptidase N
MLRGVMGDSAFFQGIRDYYRTYRDSSVLTAQFRRRMEVAAHADLGWFFRQWLLQAGYPQLDVTWRQDEAAGALVVNVRQSQPADWGRYRLPVLPVALHMADGQVLRRSMSLDERQPEQAFTFLINAAQGLVHEVVVDPDGTLLLAARVHRTNR